MKPTFHNRLLSELTREELEEEFIKNCQILDDKASEIVSLEQKVQHLSGRLAHLKFDSQTPHVDTRRMVGSQAPSAYRQSQQVVQQLQDKITLIEQEISKKEAKRDQIRRQVEYFSKLELETPREPPKSPPVYCSREDIIQLLSDLKTKNTLPHMTSKIQAAISILSGDYRGADASIKGLLEQLGEDTSFYESIERQNQLQKRRSKIEQLRTKYNQLKHRFEGFQSKKNEFASHFKTETEVNSQRKAEMESLASEKGVMEKEAKKVVELEGVVKGLKQEIEELTSQKQSLERDTSERTAKIEEQFKITISKLKEDVGSLEAQCEEAKSANEKLENKQTKLDQEAKEAKKKRDAEEEIFCKLQSERNEIIKKCGDFWKTSEQNPLDDPQFITFLTEMKERKWTPQKVKEVVEKNELAKKKISEVRAEIANYEEVEESLSQSLANKKEEVLALKERLKGIADSLGQSVESVPLPMPQFEEIKGGIFKSGEEAAGEDQTVLLLLFQGYELRSSAVGKHDSQLFIVISFIDQEPIATEAVDAKSGLFGFRTIIKCKNDYIFSEFITKSSIPIQVCRRREDKITEAAKAELNLLPFSNGINAFSETVPLLNSRGRLIGQMTFSAALSEPILKKL